MRQIVYSLLVYFGLSFQTVSAFLVTTNGAWVNLEFTNSAPVSIPDNNEFGVTWQEDLSEFVGQLFTNNVYSNIVVNLKLGGDPVGFNGDLFVTLSSSQGGYAVLLNRVGREETNLLGYGDSGFDVTFALGGDDIHFYRRDFAPVFDGEGRLTGTWGVDGRTLDPDTFIGWDGAERSASLETFLHGNPYAVWTLFAADLNTGGQLAIESWGIGLEIIPEPGTGSFILLGFLLLHRRIFRRSLPSS